MADFSFLANPPAMPDIAGNLRQRRNERQADEELRAKLGRENQFRQLAGQAYGASPGERDQFVSQAAALDPQAAASLGQDLGSAEDRKTKRLGVWARALTSAPEQMKPLLYRQMVPEMRSFGIEAPPEYTPEVGQMAQAFADMASGQTPAQLQNFRAMTKGMSPEDVERARRVELGLEGRAASGGFGFRTMTLPDGRETLVVTDPRTGGVRPATAQEVQTFMGSGWESPSGAAPLQLTGPTPGAKAAEIERAKADVQLSTAPQIAAATTRAEQTAKNEAERQKSQQQNQDAYQVYTQARNSLAQAMSGTTTGPIAGRLPAMTSAQQIAEGAQASMAPVLKQLFRTAGEGTFTDRDQQLLLDMLPTRTDHPEAATAKLQMIDQLVAAKLGAVSPQQPSQDAGPAAPRPTPSASSSEVTATGPNGQKLVLRNGQWVPLQ